MPELHLHVTKFDEKTGRFLCRIWPFPQTNGCWNLDNVPPVVLYSYYNNVYICARLCARGMEALMAEEKKKILIHTADGDHVVAVGEHKPKQTFGAMPVKDYVAAVADPDGLPQAGSVGAVVSALAAAMGSLAVRALRSDDASLQKTAEELRQMTDYMVFQIDEELRAREPLDRRRVEENVTRTDLDSALRVASDIPNEIVYIMCRCIELMKEVVDKGDDLTACSALAAVHLSMAAIRCMQAELLSYAKIMDDDVFGYTIVREAELNLADHQELVDGLVEELTRRLTREKK